jgi:hypothetical protein
LVHNNIGNTHNAVVEICIKKFFMVVDDMVFEEYQAKECKCAA